jgi:hypothetical protein
MNICICMYMIYIIHLIFLTCRWWWKKSIMNSIQQVIIFAIFLYIYICIHTYVYICMCIYMYIYMYICIYINTHIYIYIYICIYIFIYINYIYMYTYCHFYILVVISVYKDESKCVLYTRIEIDLVIHCHVVIFLIKHHICI